MFQRDLARVAIQPVEAKLAVLDEVLAAADDEDNLDGVAWARAIQTVREKYEKEAERSGRRAQREGEVYLDSASAE